MRQARSVSPCSPKRRRVPRRAFPQLRRRQARARPSPPRRTQFCMCRSPASTREMSPSRRRIANPLAQDPQAATRGMQDFIQFNCVGCHAPNAGGGMGPALSEGRFIYGSSPANLFLSIYQGRPNGMPTWGDAPAQIDDLGACRLRPEHRPSAERNVRTRRSRERRHRQPSSRRPPSSCKRRIHGASRPPSATANSQSESDRRWAGARLTIVSTALCAALRMPCQAAVAPMDYLHADGLMGEENSAVDAGSVDRLRRRRRHHRGAGPDRHFAARPRRRRRRNSAPGRRRRRDGSRSASAFRRSCLSAWSSGLP